MSLIKVVPYVLGVTTGVPGAPEPRMYPRRGYFLVSVKDIEKAYFCKSTHWKFWVHRVRPRKDEGK